jgi:2-polyprenyl-3-methyl-5-hydroxy-6-metoxy-1,4-benzoquinol methylase
MILKQKPKGILGGQYANSRIKKAEMRFRFKTRARIAANTIQKFYKMNSNLQILDFGAAEGKTMLEMNKLLPGSVFWGLEQSEDLVLSAKGMPDNIHLIHADVFDIPNEIKKYSFDVVTALAFLEHIADPLTGVKEAIKILKYNGLFIATCPVPFWDFIAQKTGFLKKDQHESTINKKKLLTLIRNNGLELIEYKRFMWAPLSFLPYLNINLSVRFSLAIDRFIEQLKVLNWLFVNQFVVGKKIRTSSH